MCQHVIGWFGILRIEQLQCEAVDLPRWLGEQVGTLWQSWYHWELLTGTIGRHAVAARGIGYGGSVSRPSILGVR